MWSLSTIIQSMLFWAPFAVAVDRSAVTNSGIMGTVAALEVVAREIRVDQLHPAGGSSQRYSNVWFVLNHPFVRKVLTHVAAEPATVPLSYSMGPSLAPGRIVLRRGDVAPLRKAVSAAVTIPCEIAPVC